MYVQTNQETYLKNEKISQLNVSKFEVLIGVADGGVMKASVMKRARRLGVITTS